MKWSKSPPELVEAFAAVLPGPPVERRPMFGYPAAFLNGNMVCGLFQDGMVLRLDEVNSKKLLAVKGCKPFAPMPNRPMRGFVFVPGSMVADEDAIAPWLERALTHVGKMAPKSKKGAGKKNGGKKKTPAKKTPAAKAQKKK